MPSILFERDPAKLAHRLVVTMNDDEAAWLLGICDAIRTQMEPPAEPPPTQGAPVPRPPRPPKQPVARERDRIAAEREHAQRKGYEGDPCNDCGQFMLTRNGTCLKCAGCGATTGCS